MLRFRAGLIRLFRGALLLLVIAGVSASSFAGDWGPWEEARALFDSGKFEEAIQSLRAHATEDARYYYNLGTASFRAGKYGWAVAYLEKANSLRLHDSDTTHNLNLARNSLGQIIGRDRIDAASSWIETTTDQFSKDELLGILGLVGLGTVFLWFRAYWRTRSVRKALVQPAGWIGAAGLLICVALFAAQQAASLNPAAVALDRQIIRSGPGDTYMELGQLEAGTKIRLLGMEQQAVSPAGGAPETWRQIRFSANSVGWIRGQQLLAL